MVFGRSLLRFLPLALVSLALVLAGSACQDGPPEDEDPGPQDTGISGSDDDDSSGGIGGDDDSASGDDDDDSTDSPADDDDDDATEPPWPAGQAGEVSYTYFFDQPSAIYWDCIRSYYWIETGDTPADGCTECERTWHVVYSIAFDSCGTWGFSGDGYDLSVGVDIADEQPVVPYGGIGLVWTLWREHEAGGGDEWTGYRLGYNAFFGAALLLDRIEQRRARQVDASTGVNDAFLTLEGRFSKVDSEFEDGDLVKGSLDFSGWSFLAGIKLVY